MKQVRARNRNATISDKESLTALHLELENLRKKVSIHLENETYVYTATYKSWMTEFNVLLKKYNAIKKWDIEPVRLGETDLSSTKKTVKPTTLQVFQTRLEQLHQLVLDEKAMTEKEIGKGAIPNHQMRKCFKTGVDRCPLDPAHDKTLVVVAMPFDAKYQDSFSFGVVPALEAVRLKHWRADEEITNKDIMCKVCHKIQSCRLVIVNISGLNPNVMFEQGLAYGIGKPVIIIKDRDTKTISDLGAIEYLEYSHAKELAEKLTNALKDALRE